MRLRHLRYFIVVAEELSFIQASVRLHIEPSPLSRAIKDLEYDVGAELLHRSRGKIRLTAAGEAFCKDARRLLALYDDAKKSARRIKDGSRGHLRIGIADSLAQPRLTRLLAMCREDEPLTPIDITEMTTDELLFGLKRDLIDAGLTMDGEHRLIRQALRQIDQQPAGLAHGDGRSTFSLRLGQVFFRDGGKGVLCSLVDGLDGHLAFFPLLARIDAGLKQPSCLPACFSRVGKRCCWI